MPKKTDATPVAEPAADSRAESAPADPAADAQPALKSGMHPRNRHRSRYDFPRLIAQCPELAPFVRDNAYGDASVDFADPAAVRALNRALLLQVYGVAGWELPPRYLCPPIPGRADYLHHVADLLGGCNGGRIPLGESVRVLDIGVGANCIYPLIGHSEYGWRFVGTDIDRAALAAAQATLNANPGHRDTVELRLQPSRTDIFRGVLQTDELFDLTLCNPPFHASAQEARNGSARKWQNLGKNQGGKKPALNFGGQGDELYCEGGEAGFVGRMVAESAQVSNNCLWFTALVSKSASLPAVYRALKQAGVQDSRTLDMAQGQKKSRIVAWTFFSRRQQQAWCQRRHPRD